jgi:hypothetical protein
MERVTNSWTTHLATQTSILLETTFEASMDCLIRCQQQLNIQVMEEKEERE